MKSFLRSRWMLALLGVVVLLIPVAVVMARSTGGKDDAITARVRQGPFKVTITSAGELRAPKAVQITVPPNAQEAEQYQMKIQKIVDEGTIVKTGDVVAELDRSTIASKLADVGLAMQKADAQYEEASLDSALNLSKAREDMRTAGLTLEEKQLAREQSQYEAPSVKHQAQIDYERAERALRQDSLDLKTKVEQAIAKMREVGSDRDRQKAKLQVVQDVMGQFTIKAPAPGMVIYVKEWNGKKRAVGSQVSSWDPAVATLPDLSVMESVTYVNEIDVRKLAIGQHVAISLDADPSKHLIGTVTQVANAGEQRPNSDAKVFEVTVSVEHPDTTLRPGMTTGNAIETLSLDNVRHVPLEALMTQQGVPFVYRRVGGHIEKQEVETGAMNDDDIVISRGLERDDRVLLSAPVDHDKIQLQRLPNSKAIQQNADSGTSTPLPPPAGAPTTKPAATKPVATSPG
ncbi:MAG TPA: efflux RND transporter periplasmic adaptor subunit [Gemmatimonadales bacterium]